MSFDCGDVPLSEASEYDLTPWDPDTDWILSRDTDAAEILQRYRNARKVRHMSRLERKIPALVARIEALEARVSQLTKPPTEPK